MSQVLVPILPVHPLYHSTGRSHIGTNPISQTLVPAIAVHLLYHKSWSLSYQYCLLNPALQIYPLYHTYWSLSFRYIPNITSTGPCSTGTSPIPQYWTLSYRCIPYTLVFVLPVHPVYHSNCHVLPVHPLYHSTCPVLPVHPLYYSTCPVLPVHHRYIKYLPCPTGTSPISKILDLRYRHTLYVTSTGPCPTGTSPAPCTLVRVMKYFIINWTTFLVLSAIRLH